MNFHSGVRTPRAAFQVASLNITASRWPDTSPRMRGMSERPSMPVGLGQAEHLEHGRQHVDQRDHRRGLEGGMRPGAQRMRGTWVTES